jgi:putative PIN family toxin of toxin-antitoxin system
VFRAGSYPGQILAALSAGRFTLITSQELLDELADVLTRPFARAKYGITPEEAASLVTLMRTLGEVVLISGASQGCRDPKDDKILETARAGSADVLVSEDKDLLSMTVPGLQIVSAHEFIALLPSQP